MSAAVVLIVDDDETTLQICRAVLEAAQLQVCCAASAEEALAEFTGLEGLGRRCDLVVTDYLMPGRNGLSLYHELRQARPDLGGILLTGHASLNIAVEALNRGFSQILSKPVQPSALLEAVRGALHEGQARRENARLQALTHLYQALNPLTSLTDPEELAQRIVELALGETTADSASLMLFDERREVLRLIAGVGLREGLIGGVEVPLGEPIAGWVLERGITLELAAGRPIPSVIRTAMHRAQLQAGVVVPLLPMGQRLGVLSVSWLQGTQRFGTGDVEIIGVLAADAAHLLQRLISQRERHRLERISTVGRLASSIIHDLRGPVTIIQGAAELLSELDPDVAPPMNRIRAQTRTLDRMCEQLLSFARHADGAPGEAVPLEQIAEAVAEIIAELQPGLTVSWQPAPEPLMVLANRRELPRALADLIASGGGRPQLVAARSGGHLRLHLSGLADRLPDLAAGGDDSWPESGVGLSLVLLRHIVERHAGRVEVEGDRHEVVVEIPLARESREECGHHRASTVASQAVR